MVPKDEAVAEMLLSNPAPWRANHFDNGSLVTAWDGAIVGGFMERSQADALVARSRRLTPLWLRLFNWVAQVIYLYRC